MDRRSHNTLPSKFFKLFWEEKEVFAVSGPDADDLAYQQELMRANQANRSAQEKKRWEVFSWREDNPISKEAREESEKWWWVTIWERKSDIYKKEFECEMTDWINPTKKERSAFPSFTDYIIKDIGEHIAAAWTLWAFIAEWDLKMPSTIKQYFEDYFSSQQGEAEFKELKNKIDSWDKKHWSKTLYHAFAEAIKQSRARSYEESKTLFCWYFDDHVKTMQVNTSKFVKWIKAHGLEKYKKLNESFPTSIIAQSIHNDLEVNFAKLNEMYDKMWTDLSSSALLQWIDMKKKDEHYFRNVLEWLKKEKIIKQEESWDCFDEVEIDGKSEFKLNINRVKALLNKLKKENDDEKRWRHWYGKIWDIKYYAYKKSVSDISREYYQEYLDKIDKIESDIDYTLTQYDEYINIWKEVWTKTREDCLKELNTLPAWEFWEREKKDMLAAIDKWFSWARETILRLREKWNITGDDSITMLERFDPSVEGVINDPLFWSLVWKDLNTVSDGFYKVFMSKDEEEEFDNADDNDKKVIKEETALQKVKKMDHKAINTLFTELLWDWGVSEETSWSFWKSEWLLRKHKNKPGCNDYIIQLDTLKDRVSEAKENCDKLGVEYDEINKKINKTPSDEKRLSDILRAMQTHAEVAANGDMVTKYIISNLEWIEDENTEIYWLSLKDIFSAFKNTKDYLNEVLESRSKKTWHQLAWDVTKYIPWMQQLSSSELAKVNQEFNAQVEKWKEWFKTLDRKWVYEELKKNIRSPWIYKKDHLQAVIETLSDKWALQIVDANLVEALNNYIPHWMKINCGYYINSLDMWEKEAVLRTKFNYVFGDNELAQKVIKQNDSNIKTKTEEARSEYDRLWDASWWRFSRIYKNYLKMWHRKDDKGEVCFDEKWQLKPGKIVNFWDSDQVDSAAYEQSVFFALEEVTMDPREALFYVIRGYATGLIPQNRLSELESRGLYSKISFLQGLRWKPISLYRKFDLILTNNWMDTDATVDWKMTTSIKDRVGLIIRKLTDEDSWNRTDRNLQQADGVDPDSWRDIIWKASFAEFQSHIFGSTAWWRVKLKWQSWSAVTLWMTDEFETFWRNYETWKIDETQQNKQADNIKETLKLWMAIDAAKYVWTYHDTTKWSDANKLWTKLKNAVPKMAPAVSMSNGEYANVLRNIAKDILSQVNWWDKIITKIYDKNAKPYIEGSADVDISYSDEFDEIMKTPEAMKKMIEVIQTYQNNGWIPTCWEDKKGREWLERWWLGWHRN